ncbi:MAG: hypothetical protein J6D03_00930 [Clostridia bacterium]|nr:hypothetical protein [Clostridia bacterium]
MDRKTNLFYNALSQDSNFLTFSNYTESMTGNFLSTDTKLFPSTFLCLKIPRLQSSDADYRIVKQEFIQNWLIRRYENKLAFLRDYCKKEDDFVESRLMPLNYLLEYIYEYDPNTEITYVDNITEQDYNGTYTDTICIIDSTKFKHANIVKLEDEDVEDLYADYKYSDKDKQRYPYSYKYLYGWYNIAKEQYRNSFDMNCDGHVDEVDLELFKENEDKVKACIKIEHPEYNDESIQAEYDIRLEQITDMVNHNAGARINAEAVGPKFKKIDTVTSIIDGECNCKDTDKCIKDENGKCCCQTTGNIIISYPTYEEIENSEDIYLSPLFDYPKYPIREDYLTDDLYDEAIKKYESADKYYRITSNLSKIEFIEEPDIVDNNSIQKIEFNVIIPLYDVIDMNTDTNSFIIDEVDEIDLQNDLSNPTLYIKNVPLGMWFSGSEPIVLKRDAKSKYCPSWSLVIGSQFKPFPYSKEIPDEITDSAKADAFMTFSQILTKQNEMIDKMSSLFDRINDLNSRISAIESNISSIGTAYNIDGINQNMINFQQYINNQLIEIKNTIAERDLVWINREG